MNILSGKDSNPPIYLGSKTISKNKIQLIFNESVNLNISEGKESISSISYKGNLAYLWLKDTLQANEKLYLEFMTFDQSKNSSLVSCNIYGKNNNPAEVLINELTTNGSAHSPDRTELLVTKSGNLAGLTLYQGSNIYFLNRFILPNLEVLSQQYYVIWWTDSLPDGVDKTKNICAKTSDLATRNGCLSIYSDPSKSATCLDCVLWANHSGSAFDKFGNKENQIQCLSLINSNNWEKIEPITGLLAVDSLKTTSTRSISRWLNKKDNNNSSDWYITCTSGSTFGSDNISPIFTEKK